MQDACSKRSFIPVQKHFSTPLVYKTVKYKTINISKFVFADSLIDHEALPLFLMAQFYCAGS